MTKKGKATPVSVRAWCQHGWRVVTRASSFLHTKKSKRLVFFGLIVVVVIFLILVYPYHRAAPPGIALAVTRPWVETLAVEHDYVAQIRSIEHILVRSLEKGYLEHIYVDEGNFIKKGKKMFQVLPVMLRAERDRAKAEYEIAKIEYDNTLMLANKDVVSANALAMSKARLDEAKAKMQLADVRLQFTTIRAPFDGMVGRFRVRLGSLLEEGQILTTMSDNNVMWVYFNVTEADYLNLKSKQDDDQKIPVKLRLANGQCFNHEGVIDTIEADFNNKTGNIAFRASFPNPENLLRHGQTGNVVLTETLNHALVIPQKSVFEILEKRYVYVINQQNEITSREVTIANEVPYLYIIQSGLNSSDIILLEGLGTVHLGQKITPHYLTSVETKATLNLPVS